jgi:hypothetical protein
MSNSHETLCRASGACTHARSVHWWWGFAAYGALAVLALGATQARATHWQRGPVRVEIVDQRGARFEQFPTSSRDGAVLRAWLRAERGAPYRIRVSNESGERVGLVIAVDGRNIISGAKSELRRREPMYVLGPWQSEELSGWRTSLANVHEFYFTEWEDSYAEAFGDRSAKGVIAVAVYREKAARYAPSPHERSDGSRSREERAKSQGAPGRAATPDARSQSEPGTGYGDRRYEPATRVAFEAESRAVSRVLLKYEWPETLCRRGISSCERNRFWDDSYGFAPPPGVN